MPPRLNKKVPWQKKYETEIEVLGTLIFASMLIAGMVIIC